MEERQYFAHKIAQIRAKVYYWKSELNPAMVAQHIM